MGWIVLGVAFFFVPLAVVGGLAGELICGPSGAFVGALTGLLYHMRG